MKIYGDGIYRNEQADLVNLAYVAYAIEKADKTDFWLKKNTDTVLE